MKHIKSYKIFLEDTDASVDNTTLANTQNRLVIYNKDISDFKAKKSQLENLVLNNTDDKDITNDVKRIIGANKILAMYLPVINIEKSLNDLDGKVKYDTTLLDERNNDLTLANGLSDPDDKAAQVKKISDRIADLKSRIADNETKLTQIQKQLTTEQDAFNKKMLASKKDLETKVKDLQKGQDLNIRSLNPADSSTTPNPRDANTITKDFTR